MYKQAQLMFGQTEPSSVIRLADGICIPTTDPANTDYQAYLAWLSAGNQPLSADADAEGSQPIPADAGEGNAPQPADEPEPAEPEPQPE